MDPMATDLTGLLAAPTQTPPGYWDDLDGRKRCPGCQLLADLHDVPDDGLAVPVAPVSDQLLACDDCGDLLDVQLLFPAELPAQAVEHTRDAIRAATLGDAEPLRMLIRRLNVAGVHARDWVLAASGLPADHPTYIALASELTVRGRR